MDQSNPLVSMGRPYLLNVHISQSNFFAELTMDNPVLVQVRDSSQRVSENISHRQLGNTLRLHLLGKISNRSAPTVLHGQPQLVLGCAGCLCVRV